MDTAMIEDLGQSLGRLRREAVTLVNRAGDFPAIDRNGRRLLACVRMMELDLGLVPPEPTQEMSQGEAE